MKSSATRCQIAAAILILGLAIWAPAQAEGDTDSPQGTQEANHEIASHQETTGDESPATADLLFSESNSLVMATGCTAELTCSGMCSDITISCSGVNQCVVGSNYVDCDGQRKYCPEVGCNPPPNCPYPCDYCLCISFGNPSYRCQRACWE